MLRKIAVLLILVTFLGVSGKVVWGAEKISQCPVLSDFKVMIEEMKMISKALVEFARDNNRLPSELKELTPKYLSSLPLEPRTGEPYIYRILLPDFYVVQCPSQMEEFYGFQNIIVMGMTGKEKVEKGKFIGFTERLDIRDYSQEKAIKEKYSPLLKAKEDLENIGSSIKSFYSQEKKYPERLEEIVPKVMHKLPLDPLSKANYVYSLKGGSFTVSCPEPEKYGAKVFKYDSSLGKVVRE